jgi:hypothetical protein
VFQYVGISRHSTLERKNAARRAAGDRNPLTDVSHAGKELGKD